MLLCSADATIDGFTIAQGDVSSITENGGGIYINYSSPTISNCRFLNNSARYGGAIAKYGSYPVTITNCTFLTNDADRGAGIWNNSGASATVINSIFSGNQATSGGGIYNDQYSTLTITNSTFSGNEVSGGLGGAIYIIQANLTITNSILWGDSGGPAPEIYDNGASNVTVTFSDVQGLPFSGTGNINEDPLFIPGI